MVEGKKKNLGDYIRSGRHEFVAFIRNMGSLSDSARSNFHTHGNDLGQIVMGVLVCDRPSSKSDDPHQNMAKFFYKSPPTYSGDSNICFSDFSFDTARIVSEVPLSLEIPNFYSGEHLTKWSKEYRMAKQLLQKYGIY